MCYFTNVPYHTFADIFMCTFNCIMSVIHFTPCDITSSSMFVHYSVHNVLRIIICFPLYSLNRTDAGNTFSFSPPV